METRRIVERRRRGLFGWLFLILFYGFNLIMMFAVYIGVTATVDGADRMTTTAEQAGYAVGAFIGVTALLWVWLIGSLILGLLAFISRGAKVTVETRG